jgi:Apocytochrome F, N-terminal
MLEPYASRGARTALRGGFARKGVVFTRSQQNYQNPREPNGRIVCANCHLAQKAAELEVPQAVLPDSVFEATIKIPYDQSIQQVQSNGKKGNLNVGMVLILRATLSRRQNLYTV